MGWNLSYSEQGGRYPVERVSFNEVQDFIAGLNDREPGSRYRLPTEEEWEYAGRAGTTGKRYGELKRIAWYYGNSGGSPRPVGTKAANSWGLHDMLGNVCELMASGVPLGGSAYGGDGWARFGKKGRAIDPDIAAIDVGFRLVRTVVISTH